MTLVAGAERIRGGAMGLFITNDLLPRAISLAGGMGMTSVEGIDHIVARLLQRGDPTNSILRTVDEFEDRFDAHELSDYVRSLYVPGGIPKGQPFRQLPMFGTNPDKRIEGLNVFAGYWIVRAAKMGRYLKGPEVKIAANKLEEVQTTVMAVTFGEMLADVDEIEISAGLPFQMRENIRKLCALESVNYNLDVHHGTDEKSEQFKRHVVRFNPRKHIGRLDHELKEPRITGVASSNIAARVLTDQNRHPNAIDQLKIELPQKTGGHSTKPRKIDYNERGEYKYGPKDEIDLELVRGLTGKMGIPFTLAGGFSTPEAVKEAIELGAQSATVATPFQYCEESGLPQNVKRAIINQILKGNMDVFIDPKISPTYYAFRVDRNIEGVPSIGDVDIYEDWSANHRSCTIGRLRERTTHKGRLTWICKAEPVEDYLRKGGKIEDTVGAGCLCENLLSAVDLGQTHKDGYEVPPLYSSGTEVSFLPRILNGRKSYTAKNVVEFLVSGLR
ncbi:MAG: hypothetical protein Q8P92_04145 [Candidatus Daviesbacteria bacterium]|nr:hypothetical protein [Candidatus Daviesbacteria bacterium]